MAVEVARLFARVGLNTRDFDRGINTMKGRLQGFDRTMGGLTGGLAGAGALLGVGAVAAFGATQLEIAKTAAEAESLKMSFDDLASGVGESSNQMLSDMRTASAGLVSDTDLIRSANRAMLLGVAESGEQMADLLEIARVRGRAMGVDLTSAFNDIVTGIGRMSPLILDNLGIVVDQAAANEKYAESLGKTAEQLTDAEKKQALLNAVIADSADLLQSAGNSALTDAEKMQSMAAAVANLRDAWGGLLLAMNVPQLYANVADGLTNVAMGLEALRAGAGSQAAVDALSKTIELSEARLRQLNAAMETATGVQRIYLQGQINLEKQTIAAARAELEQTRAIMESSGAATNAAGATQGYGSAVADAGIQSQAAAYQLQQMGIEMGNTGIAADSAARKLEQFNAIQQAITSGASAIGSSLARSAAGVAGIVGTQNAEQMLNQQLAILESQTDEMLTQGIQGEQLIFQQALLADALGEPFAMIEQANRETQKWASASAVVSQEFSNLQSAVSSAVSGALGADIGINLDDILPRQDAVNEDARRLADVAVHGFQSPWAEYFKSEFPDLFAEITSGGDIQGAAANVLREFQSGLRPELLDRDMLKDQIRQALLGQQAIQELVDEISTELASEMGIALTEVRAAAGGVVGGGTGAGGGDGYPLPISPQLNTSAIKDQLAIETPMLGTQTGEGVAGGLNDYVVENNLGSATSKTIAGQMKDAAEDFKSPGENAGEQWGMGFLERVGENVPQQLIDMLINLISPGLADAQANSESQTTAEGGPE